MRIEVAYATPEEQVILLLEAPEVLTVEQAIRASGILERFPEIDLSLNGVGIFGRVCPLESRLMPGDRVEIYRPLLVDPRVARRERARRG